MAKYSVYDYCYTARKKEVILAETIRLLDLMFLYADTFSLTMLEFMKRYPAGWKAPDSNLRDALLPYRTRSFEAVDWYGWCNTDLTIHLYPCTQETRMILSENVPYFFIRTEPHRKRMPVLEDLCFYRDGKMLLGSLSHEYMCTVFPPDDDTAFTDALESVGRWNKTVFTTRFDLPR